MMHHSKHTVAPANLCNDEELVTLSHVDTKDWVFVWQCQRGRARNQDLGIRRKDWAAGI